MAVTRAKDSEIKAAFQKFDKDNSGSLEIGELYDVLREIGLEITKEHFDGYSQIMMDDFDTDKSGALDYDEFTRFYEQVLVNESGKGQYKEMLELKEEGNTFFRSGDYLKAAATYTKAIKAAADHGIENDAKLAPIYSNRSASFLKLSKVTQALTDAEKCVELKPDWDKAHFRKAAALEASEKDAEALIALEESLKLAGADQVPIVEQKIRLVKQRIHRHEREMHKNEKRDGHKSGSKPPSPESKSPAPEKTDEEIAAEKAAADKAAAEKEKQRAANEARAKKEKVEADAKAAKLAAEGAERAAKAEADAKAKTEADAKAAAEAEKAAAAKAAADAKAAEKAKADAQKAAKADADAAAKAKKDAELKAKKDAEAKAKAAKDAEAKAKKEAAAKAKAAAAAEEKAVKDAEAARAKKAKAAAAAKGGATSEAPPTGPSLILVGIGFVLTVTVFAVVFGGKKTAKAVAKSGRGKK